MILQQFVYVHDYFNVSHSFLGFSPTIVRSSTPHIIMILISKPKLLGLIFCLLVIKYLQNGPIIVILSLKIGKHSPEAAQTTKNLQLSGPESAETLQNIWVFFGAERKTSGRTVWIIKYVCLHPRSFSSLFTFPKIVKQQDDNKTLQFGKASYIQAPLRVVCSVRKKIVAEEENNSLPFEIQSR